MKVQKFNELKREVKKGNVEGLKEVISELTLKQAQVIEDLMLDLELTGEMNEVLDEVVNYIDSLVATEKVANKKQAPEKPEKPAKTEKPEKPAKTEVQEPAKKGKENKPFNKVNVGDTFYLQVEGETIEHEILVIFKGRNNLVGIMKEDETEVFLIRKSDLNKGIFSWTDRHGEQYNIKVILK